MDSKYKLINYCNTTLSITDVYKRIFGRAPHTGKIFCPFHDNKNTPSAKIYGNSIKCFGACNRLFGVYDLLKKYDPEELEKIKTSVLLPEVLVANHRKDERVSFDRNSPISQVVTKILHGTN